MATPMAQATSTQVKTTPTMPSEKP